MSLCLQLEAAQREADAARSAMEAAQSRTAALERSYSAAVEVRSVLTSCVCCEQDCMWFPGTSVVAALERSYPAAVEVSASFCLFCRVLCHTCLRARCCFGAAGC